MKKFILIVMMITSFYAFIQPAQKIKSGIIEYQMTFEGLPDDDPTSAMFQNSTMKICFTPDRTAMVMDMGIMNTTIISNVKEKTGIMLMNMMGNKMAIDLNEMDLKAVSDKKAANNIEVTPTNDTKEIAGYICKKYLVTMIQDDNVLNMPVWVTDAIQPETRYNIDDFQSKFEGMPLEYNIMMNGMNIKLIAQDITLNKIDESVFNIPNDYKRITMKEYMNMMQGIGE